MAAMINRRMERKPDPKEPLEKLESILKTRWRTENGVIGNVARVCKDDPEDVDTVAVKYCKGIIAENNVETVRVHNVRTGEQKTFMAEHRKLLDRVDTSGRLVAATPPRYVHVPIVGAHYSCSILCVEADSVTGSVMSGIQRRRS